MAVEAAPVRATRWLRKRERIDALALASTTLAVRRPRQRCDRRRGAGSAGDSSRRSTVTSSLRAGTQRAGRTPRAGLDVATLVVGIGCASWRGPAARRSSRTDTARRRCWCEPGARDGRPLAGARSCRSSRSPRISWITIAAAANRFDYGLEERWVRDEGYGKLVDRGDRRGAAVARTCVPPTSHIWRCRVRRTCSSECCSRRNSAAPRRSDALRATCGDTGAAHPLLLLADALERATARRAHPAGWIRAGRRCAGIACRRRPRAARGSKPLERRSRAASRSASYVRYLSHAGLLDVDFGMRAERDNRTAHTRRLAQAPRTERIRRRPLRALLDRAVSRIARLRESGVPRHGYAKGPSALGARTGRVKSFTEDWQAYSPRPPAIYGNIEFAEGGNLLMELTDLDHGAARGGRCACASRSASRTSTGSAAFAAISGRP